jgi:hypothetical protein
MPHLLQLALVVQDVVRGLQVERLLHLGERAEHDMQDDDAEQHAVDPLQHPRTALAGEKLGGLGNVTAGAITL